jgi:hypothetical protein
MDTIEFKLDLLNYINNYRERQYKTLYYNYYDETTIHNYNNLYIKYKILIYSYEKLRNKVKNDYNFFINNTISEFKYIHDLQIKDYKQLFFKYKQLQIELSFFNQYVTFFFKLYYNQGGKMG